MQENCILMVLLRHLMPRQSLAFMGLLIMIYTTNIDITSEKLFLVISSSINAL
jgi:hypothetical protein